MVATATTRIRRHGEGQAHGEDVEDYVRDSATVTIVKPPSGKVKFHRELQVGLTMSRDLIDGGMGLDRGPGLDPTLFFTDGIWFILN